MTEAEWLACEDPTPMLEFLTGKASDRKLRLFAVACCRSVWHWLANPRVEFPGEQEAVATAERYADGLATAAELGAAAALTRRNAECEAWGNESLYAALEASASAARADVSMDTAREAARWSAAAAETAYGGAEATPYPEGHKRRARLLRDIVGNPFRPSPLLPAAVLAWNDGTVVRVAQAAYDERHMPAGTLDAGRLGVLADALLDAGYDDDAVVRHLREPGPHVRGCWAVDVILGKPSRSAAAAASDSGRP
jgi:hypothetical protein